MDFDESTFARLADEKITAIADAVDEELGDRIDVDVQGGILTLELPDGRQYVINKHAPNRQIWLSSPVSGAAHFDYSEAKQWVSTREAGRTLDQILTEELRDGFGTTLTF